MAAGVVKGGGRKEGGGERHCNGHWKEEREKSKNLKGEGGKKKEGGEREQEKWEERRQRLDGSRRMGERR